MRARAPRVIASREPATGLWGPADCFAECSRSRGDVRVRGGACRQASRVEGARHRDECHAMAVAVDTSDLGDVGANESPTDAVVFCHCCDTPGGFNCCYCDQPMCWKHIAPDCAHWHRLQYCLQCFNELGRARGEDGHADDDLLDHVEEGPVEMTYNLSAVSAVRASAKRETLAA